MSIPTELVASIDAAIDSLQQRGGFTPRPQQRQMIDAILATLDGSGGARPIIAVEGPTGTGKTLAYLLGTVPLALQRKQRVVVSTATVALQEQLVHRDLPDLKTHSGLEFSFTLALGRGRYACVNNLEQLVGERDGQESLFPGMEGGLWRQAPRRGEVQVVKGLLQRLREQDWDGCRDNLEYEVRHSLWQQLSTDGDRCIGRQCSNASRCPFMLARRALADADVIVANHDLVLADRAAGAGILPAPEDTLYVFDEGHHLAAKAIRQFQGRLALPGFPQLLEGLGQTLGFAIGELAAPGAALDEAVEQVPAQVREAAVAARALADAVQSLDFPPLNYGESVLRMPMGVLPKALVELAEQVRAPVEALQKTANGLRNALAQALKGGGGDAQRLEAVLTRLGFACGRLDNAAQLLRYLAVPDGADAVPVARWFKRQGDAGEELYAEASPISAAAMLRRHLWAEAAGAVITSATLTALGRFDRLARSCGLDPRDGTCFLRLPSPFDYQGRARLVVAFMRNEPGAQQGFLDEVCAQLPHRLGENEGTLVLFTARRAMEQVAAALPEMWRERVLMQGSLGKKALLDAHRKAVDAGRGSVIFGLASMAEGVDLRGDYCRHVVIVKLPFAVPDSPVEATQAEYVQAKGGNPFLRLAVPEASLKLVQACGRLLRSEDDYGRVTIFDRRLVTRSYGRQLLGGLPPFSVEVESAPAPL